jgi:aerobic C4-dicarboxylate transport protein
MTPKSDTSAAAPARSPSAAKKPWYAELYIQVLIAIAAAIVLGYAKPAWGVAMKPLGDAFIRLISMVITLIIFSTVVTGISGLQDIRKVGRVGGKALIYFEVVSTVALFIGLAVGNATHPGSGFNVNAATLDAKAVQDYAGAAKSQSVTDFLMNIIPNTAVDAFARGNILQVLLVSLLFGFALAAVGARAKPLADLIEAVLHAVFGIVNIIVKFAPIGAFGAMAFTVGRYGLASLGPLAKLIGIFYITACLFVLLVMGGIARLAGFSILRFLLYIKEEILIVVSTNSSEAAVPTLMEKLVKLGCSKPLVGLVVPTGYIFNTDGSALYMTLAALFVAQATNTPLTFMQQMAIFAVALLTSKGASGVQGASFIALVGTMMVVPTIPVAGMALILGIDRFMSSARALVNMIGNGVATLVLARWERELAPGVLRRNLTETATALPEPQEA